MVLPKPFTTTSPSIASFPAEDLASGTGEVQYYLVQDKDAGGLAFALVPTAQETEYPQNSGSNGWSSVTYVAFDLSPFNLTRTVRGRAHFIGMANHTGTNATISAYVVHYDGTTETTIGPAATSQTKTGDLSFNLGFDISRTNFAVGDILRLYVKMSNAALFISVDPLEIQPPSINASKFVVPYEVGE